MNPTFSLHLIKWTKLGQKIPLVPTREKQNVNESSTSPQVPSSLFQRFLSGWSLDRK